MSRKELSGFPGLHLSTEVLSEESSFSCLGFLFIPQTCMEYPLYARPVLGSGDAAGPNRPPPGPRSPMGAEQLVGVNSAGPNSVWVPLAKSQALGQRGDWGGAGAGGEGRLVSELSVNPAVPCDYPVTSGS